MIGALYALMTLILIPILFLFVVVSSIASRDPSAPSSAMIIIGTLIGAVFVPILYGIVGFVAGAPAAWSYNLIAGWVGGMEVEVE